MRRGTTNLDDIRRSLRLGMGPCQGGFCIYRATGIMHAVERLDGEQAAASLHHFLQERWKGVWPILYGDQLRQARLDDWIFQGLLDIEHLPNGEVRRMSHHDVLVVGTGLAGLTAAVRLAQSGARVRVLAKGVGATHLGGGTIDVLGYAPERVDRPGEALAAFAAAHPAHPYARVGAQRVAAALDWFKAVVAGSSLAPYAYTGSLDENHLLPTAIGVPKPSALVPITMAGGDLRTVTEVLAVGFRGLKDYHPALLADGLRRTMPSVTARAIELHLPVEGRPEFNALGAGARVRPARLPPHGDRGAHVAGCTSARSWRSRRRSASRRRTRSGVTSSRVLGGPCSRSRRSRPRCPACGCSQSCTTRCGVPAAACCSTTS